VRDAGYTATEALAALAIIGLAIGGLTEGMAVLGRAQSATASTLTHANAIRTTARTLDQLLAQGGPFRSDRADDFQGDASGFSFICGAQRCSARVQGAQIVLIRGDGATNILALPATAKLKFIYGGSQGVSDVWPPPVAPPPAPQWQSLQSVALTDTKTGQAAPVAVSHLWVQQAANCDFDAITQDCRPTTP
jgi:hypothetical protein